MSLKGVKKTEEHKRNIGLSNKGKKRTDEAKFKMRIKKLGIKRTKEEIQKRTETRRNNGWYKDRKKHTEKVSGENHWNYKDGRSKTRKYLTYYARLGKARRRGAIGKFTFAEWKTMIVQYNYTCPCCHRSEPKIKLTIDHIIPIARGGSNNAENIQPLCVSCNSKKHAKTIKYEN